jgi:hypothetical protein
VCTAVNKYDKEVASVQKVQSLLANLPRHAEDTSLPLRYSGFYIIKELTLFPLLSHRSGPRVDFKLEILHVNSTADKKKRVSRVAQL